MTRPHTIVAATDFSESSQQALKRAAFLARSWGAKLALVHVFNDGVWASIKAIYDLPGWASADHFKLARERLEEVGEQIEEEFGVQPELQVLAGRASQQLAGFVVERRAGMLVVGEHGEGVLGNVVLGGTALRVIEATQIPVLLVRRSVADAYRKVIIATDCSQASARAACLALESFTEAHHELVHAYRVPFESSMRLGGARDEDIQHYRDREFAAASARLEGFARDCAAQTGGRLERIALYGSPAAVILGQVRGGSCDLVAVGKHGGHYAGQLLLGSVTQIILYHAECDVLLSA